MTLLSRFSLGFSHWRDLPRPARVAVSLFLFAGFADGMVLPFFALWARHEAGIPLALIGLLLGCYAGGELLATPFIGGIADRLGRRRVLLISSTGVGLGFVLLYFAHGAFAAAGALILIGVFESVLHPTAATVIGDVTPAARLRETYAMSRVASGVGHVLGPALGALLVSVALGLVFAAAGVAMLMSAVIVTRYLQETHGHDAADEEDDDFSALAQAFRDRRLAGLLLPLALIGIASSWVEAVLPLYATRDGALSVARIGWLFTYAGALSVTCQWAITRATANWRGFVLIVVAGALIALAFAVLLIASGGWWFVVAITLFAFADMLSAPVSQAVISELAPARARATYMAAFSATHDLQDTAGPALGTWLYATAASLPWLIGVPVTIVSTALLAWRIRQHERV